MTIDEAVKVLAVYTAGYPTRFNKVSVEEAKATAFTWAVQFADIPADIVLMAVNKAISVYKHPPSICEIKEKISSLYWEAYTMLNITQREGEALSPESVEAYRRIYNITKNYKVGKPEPTLNSMIGSSSNYLLEG